MSGEQQTMVHGIEVGVGRRRDGDHRDVGLCPRARSRGQSTGVQYGLEGGEVMGDVEVLAQHQTMVWASSPAAPFARLVHVPAPHTQVSRHSKQHECKGEEQFQVEEVDVLDILPVRKRDGCRYSSKAPRPSRKKVLGDRSSVLRLYHYSTFCMRIYFLDLVSQMR